MGKDARESRTDPERGSSSPEDGEYADHLERGRTVWDRWSDWYEMSDIDLEPMREAAMDRLDLRPGDRVLGIGRGPDGNVGRIRSDVGDAGTPVAVDFEGRLPSGGRRLGRRGIAVYERRDRLGAVDRPSAENDTPLGVG